LPNLPEGRCAILPLQALFDLEATNAELKSDLRDLYITSAQEVDVSSGRKAIIIHVSCLSDGSVGCTPQLRPQL
jgi:Ribosomal protein S7e